MSHLRLVVVREPDTLPATWGDRRVTWEPWIDDRMFVCPPPPVEPCPQCGSTARGQICPGLLHPLPGETFELTDDVESKRRPGSFYERTRNVPAWPVYGLSAFRCGACGRIEIYDHQADEVVDCPKPASPVRP